MRDISYSTWISRALARALLADPSELGLAAMRTRAATALGENPPRLARLLRPLSRLSPPTWQAMNVSSLAEAIAGSSAFALAFKDGARPRIRHLFLPTARMFLTLRSSAPSAPSAPLR
jgi:hypothetical protein